MLEVKELEIQEIKPYDKNPRKNDKAVEYVMKSIKEFGFKVPIVVDKDNVIITGHTRYKAAKKLGLKVVPCIKADELDDDQVKAYRLADNKVSEFSQWDNDLLLNELDELYGIIDMNEFGFPVQIENIDEDVDAELPISAELGEANNYVVLEFNTESEWEDAITILGLQKVSTPDKNTKIRRHGIGRIVQGKTVLDMIRGIE